MTNAVDVAENLTVQEHANSCGAQKIWLCPRFVRDPKLSPDPLLQGIECTRISIPVALRDMKVTRYFRESKTECIIWENFEYEKEHRKESSF